MFKFYKQILFYALFYNLFIHSHAIPIQFTDTDIYLPSDDPNITNLLVSQYHCEKQHKLRRFNLFNVKPCTEAPSNIQHAKVKVREEV